MKVSLQRMRRMGTYNTAGYDYLKKVIAPGGYWREFTYDTLGRLQTRVVQVSGGSQTTSYSYDNWGRLTTIDYPTSDDVSYTYDAENRRLSMTDGIGTQAYEYDAWGRVTRKTNCCGGDITSTYDPAGRRLTQTEEAHERTIEYTYDTLGRLETIGDYRGTATYSYDSAGRLSREDYPNETYVQYTYYGSTGSQAGQLHKQEHRLSSNNSLIIGYEYSYDALGRVIESVETPSEDTTEYEYWASGRLKKEERKGDVAYSREYAYNPDGSRDSVIRDDALNGSFWEVYVYNETSGRLESVMDIWTSDTHEFEWKPEGTLARWTDPNADYERVFSYDEEGRLTKIERDNGPSVQTAYEYSYTGDGVKARMQDYDFQLEFTFGCAIACGEQALRTLGRPLGNNDPWESVDDWLLLPDGQAVARHWTPPISQQQSPIDVQIYISYDMFGIPLITDQSSNVITSRGQGSSGEHCEKLKEMLESLKVGVCKTQGRCLDPADCKRFNDILYSFCYECQNHSDFRWQCDIYASWYYSQSGCKAGNPFPPMPGRPFLPPVLPGYPVAPRPQPTPFIPTPCQGDMCNIPVITAPSSPPREPCPIHHPDAFFICRHGITDNPTSCARAMNGFRGGQSGHSWCLRCCDTASNYYGWSTGKTIDCKNACGMFDPGSWRW